jgi:hypothetical protein
MDLMPAALPSCGIVNGEACTRAKIGDVSNDAVNANGNNSFGIRNNDNI